MTVIGIDTREPVARQAVTETAPFAVALIPFGLAVGGASAAAGLSAWESAFGGVALLAGASQLAAIEVIGTGGGIAAAAILVALINLRFVLYGAGVARWFGDTPIPRRVALAIPIVDQTFILCQERFAVESDSTRRQRYYLASTAVLVTAFIGSQVVAFQIGGSLPDGLGLHLAAPLAFAGMLAKATTTRLDVLAGAVAAVVVLIGSGAAGVAALPLGVVIGAVTATTVDRRKR